MNTEQPRVVDAKRRANLRYYKKRYANDPNFRQKESERCGKNVMKKYNTDPEVRERMKAQALARYYRIKAEKENKGNQ